MRNRAPIFCFLLGLTALVGLSSESLRPGHHVHVDTGVHHHHLYLGAHTHGEGDTAVTHRHAMHRHDAPTEDASNGHAPETPASEAPSSDEEHSSPPLLLEEFFLDAPESAFELADERRPTTFAATPMPATLRPLSRPPGEARGPPSHA